MKNLCNETDSEKKPNRNKKYERKKTKKKKFEKRKNNSEKKLLRHRRRLLRLAWMEPEQNNPDPVCLRSITLQSPKQKHSKKIAVKVNEKRLILQNIVLKSKHLEKKGCGKNVTRCDKRKRKIPNIRNFCWELCTVLCTQDFVLKTDADLSTKDHATFHLNLKTTKKNFLCLLCFSYFVSCLERRHKKSYNPIQYLVHVVMS